MGDPKIDEIFERLKKLEEKVEKFGIYVAFIDALKQNTNIQEALTFSAGLLGIMGKPTNEAKDIAKEAS